MSESGDWYCRNCGYITSARVTHSETCDQCHIPVEWHDAEQQDELTTLRAQVQELEGREPRPEPITDESFPEDEQVLLGHYDERENMWLWVSSGHFDSEAEKWFCDWSDDYFPPVGHQGITHWMPLPSPPPEDKSDG